MDSSGNILTSKMGIHKDLWSILYFRVPFVKQVIYLFSDSQDIGRNCLLFLRKTNSKISKNIPLL